MSFEFKDAVVKKMKLDELRQAEYNPREIDDQAFKGLGNSIKEFGLLVPIVWNKKTGNIVGGHQRYRHLVEVGELETDVVVVDLDDQDEVALNITLNNPHIRGQFTKDVLRLLALSEVQMGQRFADIGLVDLRDKMKELLKEPKEKPEKNTDLSPSPEPEPEQEPEKPEAMITCPECGSKWRMKDNKIMYIGEGYDEIREKNVNSEQVENQKG